MCLRVLDTVHGRPARDLPFRVERQLGHGWSLVYAGQTDASGSACDVVMATGGHDRRSAEVYRVTLDCAGYFGLQGISVFYREASVTFIAGSEEPHCLTVMVSPLAITTCRTTKGAR